MYLVKPKLKRGLPIQLLSNTPLVAGCSMTRSGLGTSVKSRHCGQSDSSLDTAVMLWMLECNLCKVLLHRYSNKIFRD